MGGRYVTRTRWSNRSIVVVALFVVVVEVLALELELKSLPSGAGTMIGSSSLSSSEESDRLPLFGPACVRGPSRKIPRTPQCERRGGTR